MADKPLVIESGQVKQLPSGTTLQTDAATAAAASINLPHGTAPTSPVDGDCWTTTAGLFCRINGTTIGPLGAPGAVVFNEVPSGAINASNTSFALAHTPTSGIQLYLNGVLQQPGSGKDYALSGTTITMTAAPNTGDVLLATYQY